MNILLQPVAHSQNLSPGTKVSTPISHLGTCLILSKRSSGVCQLAEIIFA